MKHKILYRPAFSLLKVDLEQGETISAEAGAMVGMSNGIQIETGMRGGLFGAVTKSVLGGESFFVNSFKAGKSGEVTLAPPLAGDIFDLELKNQTVYAQSGAYIASSSAIQVDTKWGGAKTFFSREGLFLLRISGSGTVFLSSYGAIHEIELQVGQSYIVDTGHMVAFTEGVGYTVKSVGGARSTLFSGEGLVCELTGPGKIMIQSRSAAAFLSWLIPQIPNRR